MIASAHRIARAGPSNEAKKPSPAVFCSDAVEPAQLPPHERVMTRDQVAPACVTELRHVLGGADDVGEHHGGQHPLRNCRWRNAGDKQLDLVDELWREEDLQIVVAADLRRLSAGDAVRKLDGGLPLESTVEDQRRHAHGGQQVAQVSVVERSVERIRDGRGGAHSQVVGEQSPLVLRGIECRAEVAQDLVRELLSAPSVA